MSLSLWDRAENNVYNVGTSQRTHYVPIVKLISLMTFREVIVVCSVNHVEISEVNVETFRLSTEWSMWQPYIISKLTQYFDTPFLFCNAPNMNRIATVTFLPGYNFPCVFFRYKHQGTPDVNSIIYCSLIFLSLSACLYVYISVSVPLHFGRLHTPYAHLPRDHLLPFLYATNHPVIYDGRKPHSKKRKLRNKVG